MFLNLCFSFLKFLDGRGRSFCEKFVLSTFREIPVIIFTQMLFKYQLKSPKQLFLRKYPTGSYFKFWKPIAKFCFMKLIADHRKMLWDCSDGFFPNDRSSRSQMFLKTVALKNIAYFTRKHLCWSLLFQLYWKETPTQVLFCEICEIFKSTFFNRINLVGASAIKRLKPTFFFLNPWSENL